MMYLFILFFFSFLLRLINLNQSLWLDEAVVAKVVHTIPWYLIPTQFSPGDFHPPLYYLTMSWWTWVFGSSEIALRMPSVLFSLVAGWYMYKIGTLLRDRTVGLWSAAFFLLNPLIVYYSQEARMYMMATMFLSIALLYFLKSTRTVEGQKSKVKSLILFNLFCALAIFTFYGSVFFVIGMIIWAVCVIPMKIGIQKGNYTGFRIRSGMTIQLIIGLIISLLLLSPLLIQQLHTAKLGLAVVKNWSLVLGRAELKNFLMMFIKFSSGRLSWYPKWSYYAAAGGWLVVVGMLLFVGARKNKLFAFLFLFPLVVGYAISFWVPMMQYFRFLYVIIPMSVLLALSVPKKHNIAFIILALFAVFSFVYLFLPQFHREDWKDLGAYLDSQTPVYMILPSSDPVAYYNPDAMLYELRDIAQRPLPEVIEVIPYVEDIYGFNHTAVLTGKGCTRDTTTTFRGPLFLEKWVCLSRG